MKDPNRQRKRRIGQSWIENEKPIHELVKLVNEQKPDLIVFTGDLVNQRSCELEGFQNILSQLHAKDGVYSILGNHDYGSYYRWKDLKEQVNNIDNLCVWKRQWDGNY